MYTTVLVKESLVPKCKFTGNKIKVVMANGRKFTYPEARITMNIPFFVGDTLAACLKSPLFDLVIGQIDGVTNGVVNIDVGAVTTRQEARNEQTKSAPKLKVKEVLEVMKSKDIGQQQKDDRILDNIVIQYYDRKARI